jgi:hypothetical protein
MYRAGSLMTRTREISRYKLDLVGGEGVRWDRGVTQPEFFNEKGNENHDLGTRLFVHKRTASAVKTVEFVSDTMSYITLKGHGCDVIFLQVHASTEE